VIERIHIDKQTPQVYQAMKAVAVQIRARAADVGLSRITMELVNVRASQINRCATCLDIHTRMAVRAGETPQRLAVLPAWRDADLFSDVECAALEIAEAVTLVALHNLADADYTRLREHLTDDQLSVLLWAATTINAFNRVAVFSGHRVTPRTGG
jgi:AhpD family alkylhydroperoxidase